MIKCTKRIPHQEKKRILFPFRFDPSKK
jgi:hypothetical protein